MYYKVSLHCSATGVEEKPVLTSDGDEGCCYTVTRRFTFTVEFLADHTLGGMLKHEDIEDDSDNHCGSSTTISGSWRVTDAGDVFG